jgi:hypothetical protein
MLSKRLRGNCADFIKTGRAAFHLFFFLKKAVTAFSRPEFALAKIAIGLVGQVSHDGLLPDFGLF